jgi:hypothetical protein
MKRYAYVLAVLSFLTLNVNAAFAADAPAADAKHPCKEKHEAKHAARKTLHECIEGWAKDVGPDAKDPAGDCGDKLSDFVKAAKDLKACRADHMKKK